MSKWLELENLNEKQMEAVLYNEGPLFVIAGAGTGKTKTLTTKIAYLVYDLNINAKEILAFTFTNKAAREIVFKCNQLFKPIDGMWLNTFHSFGLKVLREDIDKLNNGYLNNFTVIDQDDVLKVINEVIKDNNFDSKKYSSRQARALISDIKYENFLDVTDEGYKKIYELYIKSMKKQQLVDFDDLIIFTRKLFKENKEVLTKYQNKFKYILVDEFQDTDKFQYDIIYMLGHKHKNIFLVGDPDQSIYGFRGANYENNSKFIKDFDAKVHVLDLNYRSTNAILNKANLLISNNKNRPQVKNLESNLGFGEDVIIYPNESDYDEANYIMEEITKLIRLGYKYKDIAVLYRHNALSRMFENKAIEYNIPYKIYGGLSFYDRKEIKDILAYLRVIINPHQDFFLKRIINVPRRKIGKMTVDKLSDSAIKYNTSMFDAIDLVELSNAAKRNLNEFKNIILKLQEDIKDLEDIKELINLVSTNTGYSLELINENTEEAKDRLRNISELSTIFIEHKYLNNQDNITTIINVLDQLSLMTDRDRNDYNDNQIILSTFHQVKGLEFPVVFMPTLEQGLFPDERSLYSSSELEEERRVAYVGMTRAMKKLYLTYAQKRMLYGQLRFNRASQFISEVIENKNIETRPTRIINTTHTRVIKKKSDYELGSTVTHKVFGDGVVVSIDDDTIKVAFKMPHGIKLLNINHPALSKL